MGSGCIDPYIVDVGTRWRQVISFTPRPLNPRRKSPGIHWIVGWVGPGAGLDDVKKILDPSVVQPVASRYTDYARSAPIIITEMGRRIRLSERKQARQMFEGHKMRELTLLHITWKGQ
jgi:hypothetical protein